MDDRIDNLEVGIGLNDRDLVEGLAKAESKVDKFATKVRKTAPAVEVKLNDLNFRKGARVVNLMIKELSRKEATVAIKADTKGFLRAYAQVRLALRAVGQAADKNVPLFANASNFVQRFFNRLGQKGPFESFARGLLGVRIQMGFFSTTIRQALGVLTVFGPIVESVIGSVVALAGAIGEGLVGAAAVGGSGLLGMIAVLGGLKAAVSPTLQGVDAAVKAQKAYQTQVQKTGRDSDAAKGKLKALNSTMAHVPESSRAAIRTWGEVRTQFREMTREAAEAGVSNVLQAGANTARAVMPQFARQTNRAAGTIGGAAQSAGEAIRGDEIKGQIDTIMSGFNVALPLLLQGFGQLGELMLRIFSAASPFVDDLARGFRDWATELNNSNDDAGVLAGTLGRMWGMFKNIWGLLSSAGGLLKTVLSGGAAAGDSLVDSLKRTLDHWNAILQTPQGQRDMADFFARAEDTAKKLGPALVTLVGNMAEFSEATKPIADSILLVVTAIGKFIGVVQDIPGAGPILSFGLGVAIVAQKMGLLLPAIKLVRDALAGRALFAGLAAIGPGGWVILGLTALVIAFKVAWDHSETFRDIMTAVGEAVKSGFISLFDTLLGGLSSMLTAFGKIAKHIPGMKGLGKAAIGAAEDIDKMRDSLNKVPPKKDVKVKVTIDEVDFAGQATGDAAKGKAFGVTGDGLGRAVSAAATNATQRRARTNKAFASRIADSAGGGGGLGAANLPSGSANLQGADPRLGGFGRIARGFGLGVSPGGGKRPAGTKTSTGGLSWHNTGEAVDFGNGAGPDRAKMSFFNVMRSRFGSRLAELIYSPAGGRQIKNGRSFLYGEPVRGDHFDHVHVAMDLGAKGQGIGASGGGGRGQTNRIGQNFRGDGLGIGDGLGRGGAAEQIWQFLMGQGLSPAQTAGVIGSLQQESGLSTTIVNQSSGATGLAQWLGGRLANLKKRPNWQSLSTQLSFLWSELQGPESAAYKRIKGAHTIQDAVSAFTWGFERPGKGEANIGARNTNARNAFNALKGVRGSAGGGGPSGPTKQEIKQQKRKLQQKLDRIDDKLRALRQKKGELPSGKKGTAQRAALNAQINKLMGQRTALARRKRDLPTGRDPVEPVAVGSYEGGIAQNDLALAEAAIGGVTRGPGGRVTSSPELREAAALQDRLDIIAKEEAALRASLKKNLTPGQRQQRTTRLTSVLGEKKTVTERLAELDKAPESADTAGSMLEFLAAQAAGTADLGDDVAVMNQQLALWQTKMADRTKTGDIAGMTEAQNAINDLTGNLADANKQMVEGSIRTTAGLDPAEAAVQLAESTDDLADDYTAYHAQYAALLEAQAGASTNQRGDLVAQYQIDINNAMRNMNEASARIVAARRQAEEAPLLANKALAELTDTTSDDIAATQALLGLHEARLAQAQSTADYAAIANEAGIVKSLRDELNQQQGAVFEQTRLFGEARADLYKTFGSNYATITPVGTAVGGKQIVVNNYYKTQPIDPHTWSRDVQFELQAAG